MRVRVRVRVKDRQIDREFVCGIRADVASTCTCDIRVCTLTSLTCIQVCILSLVAPYPVITPSMWPAFRLPLFPRIVASALRTPKVQDAGEGRDRLWELVLGDTSARLGFELVLGLGLELGLGLRSGLGLRLAHITRMRIRLGRALLKVDSSRRVRIYLLVRVQVTISVLP